LNVILRQTIKSDSKNPPTQNSVDGKIKMNCVSYDNTIWAIAGNELTFSQQQQQGRREKKPKRENEKEEEEKENGNSIFLFSLSLSLVFPDAI
jgi:hypothetical protein